MRDRIFLIYKGINITERARLASFVCLHAARRLARDSSARVLRSCFGKVRDTIVGFPIVAHTRKCGAIRYERVELLDPRKNNSCEGINRLIIKRW